MNISSFGRRILQAADGTIFGTIAGLGTAAYKNTGTSGNTIPLLDGTNTASGVWTFSANPSVTGGAISFPATQVASAGANDLDDYEEGTWTPTLNFSGAAVGITYGAQTGVYTKIGRVVHVIGRITLTNKGSSVGLARMAGLPFTSTAAAYGPGTFGYYANLTGLTGAPMAYVEAGQAYINLNQDSSTTIATMSNSNFTNTTDIIVSAVYIV